MAWVLSHPEVTGIATPGDVRLLPLVSRPSAIGRRAEAESVLGRVPDYSSPFINIPI